MAAHNLTDISYQQLLLFNTYNCIQSNVEAKETGRKMQINYISRSGPIPT